LAGVVSGSSSKCDEQTTQAETARRSRQRQRQLGGNQLNVRGSATPHPNAK